jgi:parvulin-like peptidyl-prolyl isomerase
MRINGATWTLFLTVACLVLYGCDIGNIRPKPYVAVVNGEKIYLTEFQDRMATELGLPRDSDAYRDKRWRLLREGVLESLINEKVMLQRAEALSLKVTDEELNRKIGDIKKEYSEERFNRLFAADKIHYGYWREAQRRRLLLEKLIALDVKSRVSVSDDEVRAHLEAHKNGDAAAKRVHVLQILLHSKVHAEQVLKKLTPQVFSAPLLSLPATHHISSSLRLN